MQCVSIDPGDKNFAYACVVADGAVGWFVSSAEWCSIRREDDATWCGKKLAAALTPVLKFPRKFFLVENQHLNNDRGNQIAGAIKMFADTHGIEVVTGCPAARGRRFRFATASPARLAKSKNPSCYAYYTRKRQSALKVSELIAAYPERFSQKVRETFRRATERTGKFDLADAITSGIECVERRRRLPKRSDPPPPAKKSAQKPAKRRGSSTEEACPEEEHPRVFVIVD